MLLVICLAIGLGSGATGVVIAFAVASTPEFARLTQTQAASISGANYLAGDL